MLCLHLKLRLRELLAHTMTDISNPRPQVNAALFKNYVGRRVTTVIKVSRNEGGTLVGDAPDGIQITVRQVPPHAATSSVFVEVIGVVENDHSLRAEVCTSFGDNFGEFRVMAILMYGTFVCCE